MYRPTIARATAYSAFMTYSCLNNYSAPCTQLPADGMGAATNPKQEDFGSSDWQLTPAFHAMFTPLRTTLSS